MRRPDGYTTIKPGEMSTSPAKSSGIGVDPHIDQMMKILGAPLSTATKPGTTNKTFGVPLADLVARQSDETSIPLVVRRLCEFIRIHGLGHEGIFRVNGNVKVIDSLKRSFDKLADANLEEVGDVIAAASLLKLFFRELPEAIIPKYLHSQFVQAQEDVNFENDDSICQLKQLLEQLPQVNFNTLRYLMAFLAQVARHGAENRMTSTSLGIVFGPNLFRHSEDLEGLRQQTLTNQLVTRFINNFSMLFEADGPNNITGENKNPDERETVDAKADVVDDSPISSFDSENDMTSSDSTTSVSVIATEFVDMAISKTALQRKKSISSQQGEYKPSSSVLSSSQAKKVSENQSGCNGKTSTDTEINNEIDTIHSATLDTRRRDWCCTFDDEYHENKRSMERSQPFQRISKTRKIRRNVRKSHSLGSLENGVDFTDKDSLKENEEKSKDVGQQQSKLNGRRVHCMSHSLDLDTMAGMGADRPSHPFLELHPQPQVGQESSATTDSSPSTVHKAYVPPLDLSILHEHGDGSEPIPINRLRASWPLMHVEKEEIDVMLSPRTSQIKNKINSNLDPNVPPSPPVEQDAFLRMNMKEDEAATASIKHLNKRIYHLKRKIKQFEESFEEEYGYKPSHADKMARSDIKKHMSELNRARRDLKQFKEESMQDLSATRQDSLSLYEKSVIVYGKDMSEIDKHAIEDSLQEMLQELAAKRHVAHRPDDLMQMNQQEVLEEKVAIQKSLLQFESVFGRPSTKPEMDIMRPIYDRYRSVKRLLSKLGSPKAKEPGTELEPILEHQAMDFIQASPQHKSSFEEEMIVPEQPAKETPDTKKAKKSHAAKAVGSSNLHELNTFELLEQHRKVKEEKKRLRRILHEFETEFQRQTGSQVKREDRTPLESLYGEYKHVKAKLKLLEALLSKHKTRYTV